VREIGRYPKDDRCQSRSSAPEILEEYLTPENLGGQGGRKIPNKHDLSPEVSMYNLLKMNAF